MTPPYFFEDIPEAEWTRLTERITAAKGRVIVVVHPFYDERSPHPDPRAWQDYLKTTKKLLGNSKAPIILLEEEPLIARTRVRLRQLGADVPVLAPTICGMGTLLERTRGWIHPDPGNPANDDAGLAEGNPAKGLILKLKAAGATHVLVAGSRTYRHNYEPLERIEDAAINGQGSTGKSSRRYRQAVREAFTRILQKAESSRKSGSSQMQSIPTDRLMPRPG